MHVLAIGLLIGGVVFVTGLLSPFPVHGVGLEPSIKEATALLETAAGKGSTEAQRLLATMVATRQN